ncbi:hypothetical protein QBC37DRAFT_367378 [Rhypophila decipiens]|uniref:Uncharacterized protein n=1 Tax=Rhypophila decipiens TaxID=261697 RepID=A0AAN7BC48_9PEZI|nr:hypothetical protein QBC37DRAFT_367378 [Rhypophila decipiens]
MAVGASLNQHIALLRLIVIYIYMLSIPLEVILNVILDEGIPVVIVVVRDHDY